VSGIQELNLEKIQKELEKDQLMKKDEAIANDS